MSRQSNRTRLGNCQTVDRISSLPDTILHHILSFVPTKSAVKTSLLSKQWRYIWTKVPALDFSEMPHSMADTNLTGLGQIDSNNFVDKVLIHNDAPYVRLLRLNLDERDFLGDPASYLISWLGALARREIQEIYVELDLGREQVPVPILLPARFLSGEKLVVLKLDGLFAFNVPVSLHLPNLEVLHLVCIQLPNDQFMKSLTSGCPVLKELHIKYCRGIRALYIESVTLKTLKLKLNVESSQSFVVIKAPNLGCLHMKEHMEQYDICDMGLLMEAKLDIFGDQNELQVLSKMSSVKNLCLKTHVTSSVPSLDVFAALTFGNLTFLELNTHCSIMCMFLKCAPMLKSLIIENETCCDCTSEHKYVPNRLPFLESVELGEFVGKEEDLNLVEYFLKAGSMLKKIKIILCRQLVQPGSAVNQKLLMLPRSSPICQVEVIPQPYL